RGLADTDGRFVADVIAAGHGYLADATFANELHGLANRRRRAPVQADLRHPLRFLGDRDHLLPFTYGQAKRFLDIDVFPRPARRDELQRVPVIWRGNHDGVDVLAIDEFAEIVMQPGLTANFLLSCGQIRLVDIAQADDLGILVAQERVEQLIAAIADADHPQAHALIAAQDRHAARVQRGQSTGGGYAL